MCEFNRTDHILATRVQTIDCERSQGRVVYEGRGSLTFNGVPGNLNNFDLPAFTITQLYKSRWQVELFFKWIKQHLRIKAFYGHSENAVKT